jgi:hypothetical protein
MSFEAKYYGRCAGCEERIEPGDQVEYADEELVHTHCDPQADPDAPTRNEKRCPACFTIHAGECL